MGEDLEKKFEDGGLVLKPKGDAKPKQEHLTLPNKIRKDQLEEAGDDAGYEVKR